MTVQRLFSYLLLISFTSGFIIRSARERPGSKLFDSSYLATCIPGLSDVLSQELTDLGCKDVQRASPSAVRFTASPKIVLMTLLWVRTAHKIMEYLSESVDPIISRDDLYQFARESLDVKDLLGDGQGGLLTISVQVMLNNPSKVPKDINHSHFTSLTIKNALCDKVRDLRGDRPNVDTQNPDVPLVAAILGVDQGATVSIFRQLHEGSLHRRGYRQGTIHKASMKESLAAGLLLQAGWDKTSTSKSVLIDPMCGSGSLLLEGAMIASDLAPGLMRIKCGLPFQNQPCILRWKSDVDLDSEWKKLLLQATERAKTGLQRLRSGDVQIIGNDIYGSALDLCEDSMDVSGISSIVLENEDCHDFIPEVVHDDIPWMVVTNPPWGVRLTEDMGESWEALRYFLRETCPPNSEAWVLSGNAQATKHLGLRRSSSFALKTGQQDLRWIQYKILDRAALQIEDPKDIKRELKRDKRPVQRQVSSSSSSENEWLID